MKFWYDAIDQRFHSEYPFTRDGVYVFLGEIPNMPSHCILADHRTGRIYSGYNTDDFRELTEDEV